MRAPPWLERSAAGALLGVAATLLVEVVAQQRLPLPLLLSLSALIGASCLAILGRGTRLPSAGHRPAPQPKTPSPLLDTSALIDGRLPRIAKTGFLPTRLTLPSFVLEELQRLADAHDDETRRRGRRGLATLAALRDISELKIDILESAPPDQALGVDDRLMLLAQTLGAGVITTDFNLQQVAEARALVVHNPHQLASAMKAPLRRGERIELTLVRPGRAPGQALGYLDDGTMVVVEGGAAAIGSDMEVVVSGSAQSDRGLLLFAKPAEATALDAPSGPA